MRQRLIKENVDNSVWPTRRFDHRWKFKEIHTGAHEININSYVALKRWADLPLGPN